MPPTHPSVPTVPSVPTGLVVAGGGFPSNSTLLDSFNRANETPVGQPFDGGIAVAAASLNVVANQLQTISSGSARLDGPFGPNVDVQASVIAQPDLTGSMRLYARMTDGGTALVDGVFVQVVIGSPNDTWTLQTIVNGAAPVQLGVSAASPSGAAAIGLRCNGTTFEGWKFSGGLWTQVLSRTDATITLAGSVGVLLASAAGEAVIIDDLRGGTF